LPRPDALCVFGPDAEARIWDLRSCMHKKP
jgi:hypothetical protein